MKHTKIFFAVFFATAILAGSCVLAQEMTGKQKQEALGKITAQVAQVEKSCRADINRCDCAGIENTEGRRQCELAVIEAKYQAQKAREDKMKQCEKDLDNCDCNDIADTAGQAECSARAGEAKEFKAKIQAACKEDPINCDCSEIKNDEGKAQCEEGKKKGLEEADNKIKEALSKCFRNVDACDCSALGLEKPEFVSFCDIQKTYGLNCKHKGADCEKLENVDIYPPGMPAWLGKIFAKSYGSYVNNEKVKGAKEAAGIISQCLITPMECACEKTPVYARAFCEKNKALQIKCEADDYDACVILDQTPNLPEGVPSFSYNILDKLIMGLRNAKAELVKANAARKIGAMILECMDDASKCDCGMAPRGEMRSFCEHKKLLVGQCREQKMYEACFKLDEEAIVPPGMPGIIASYINKNIAPQVETKKQKIFDGMKTGTICEKEKTIQSCKKIYYE